MLLRNKKGLINFVGSISKTLLGTLDDKDLDHINYELDKLSQDNGLLASSIFNQTRIIKTFLNLTSHDLITLNERSRQNVEKYNHLVSQTNSNTRNIAISNQITLCTLELTGLSDDSLRICKRFQPSYLISEVYTCENQIVRNIIKSLDYKMCQLSPFKINKLVYIQLYQENGYIIIPEREIEINVLCSEQSSNRLINGVMLLESSDDCVINSDSIIMKLRKTYETRKNIHLIKTIVIPFDAAELDLIGDKMLPLQKTIIPTD